MTERLQAVAAALCVLVLWDALLRLRRNADGLALVAPGRYRRGCLGYLFAVMVSFAVLASALVFWRSRVPSLLEWWPVAELTLAACLVSWLAQLPRMVNWFGRRKEGDTRHDEQVARLERSDFTIPEELRPRVTRLVAECGVSRFSAVGSSPAKQLDASDREGLGTAWAQITSLVLFLDRYQATSGGSLSAARRTKAVKAAMNGLKVIHQRLAHRTARLFELLQTQEAYGGVADKLERGAEESETAFAARTTLQESLREVLVYYRAEAKALAVGLFDLAARAAVGAGGSRRHREAFLERAGFAEPGEPKGRAVRVLLVLLLLSALAVFAYLLWQQAR
jgi:hypothetical protein